MSKGGPVKSINLLRVRTPDQLHRGVESIPESDVVGIPFRMWPTLSALKAIMLQEREQSKLLKDVSSPSISMNDKYYGGR